MGEYIIYHHGKIAAYLCDDRLLVKILPGTTALMPEASREPPYEGAKDYFYIADVDDCDYLSKLVMETCSNLPEPKPRRKK